MERSPTTGCCRTSSGTTASVAPRRGGCCRPESARLVTHFLADPLARLPSFPRYGPTEFPFSVALKTGTSQGYRDAWLVAWSRNHLVGVWVGRGDAGTMTRLTGARSAARLARAILMRLEGSAPGDLAEASFPAPQGHVPAELCAFDGRRSAGGCGQTLTEWVPVDDLPPVERAMAAVPHAWAKANARVGGQQSPPGEVTFRIVAPDHNSRIWRNPETPPGLERLALKAVVDPPVPQVVWYVDGEPFSVAGPDEAVFWPISPGQHRFELRLPHRSEGADPVRVVVE